MNPQSPGTGGRGPYDSWGRPYGASRQPGPQGAPQQPGPQQPGPEYVYEMPEDFQEQQSARQGGTNGNANGRHRGSSASGASGAGSWSAGSSDSPIPGMSAKDFQKMCRSVDRAFSQFARMVDQGVNEAAEALGASKPRAFACAIIPQVLPSYISNTLFCFEGNVRYASILGFVGAGGLGLVLNERLGWRDYASAGTILIMLFVTVFIIETISRAARKRLV